MDTTTIVLMRVFLLPLAMLLSMVLGTTFLHALNLAAEAPGMNEAGLCLGRGKVVRLCLSDEEARAWAAGVAAFLCAFALSWAPALSGTANVVVACVAAAVPGFVLMRCP